MTKRNAVGTTTINAINKLIESLDAESFTHYDKLKACLILIEDAYKVYANTLAKKRLKSLVDDQLSKMSDEDRMELLKKYIA